MPYESGAKTLVEVVQNLSSVRTLDEITKYVRTAARQIAQADGATFVLRDNGFCYYVDEDAISPLWKGQRFPMSACISGWSMLHKQAVVIEDIYQDSRIPIDAYRPTFVKSLAMTPIRKNDPIGAIGTYWKDTHRPTQEQLELLQALADTTSVAIENVNLYTSLQSRIDELNRANQAKNEFLTTLSHEMRTPLNAILGWSEILADEEWDNPDVQEGVNTIRRNAQAQSHVIEELLDVSQMVSGKMQIRYQDVNLVDCVQAAIASTRIQAEQKNIKVVLHNKLQRSRVQGDPIRLKQIVQKLLSNAIKFSPAQSPVEVRLFKAGPHLQVEVSDHGVGIEADFLPRVFEIFKQGDASVTRKYGGLGLGLSIAQNLARAHRGEIRVSSPGPNQGSTFTLSIPEAEIADSLAKPV